MPIALAYGDRIPVHQVGCWMLVCLFVGNAAQRALAARPLAAAAAAAHCASTVRRPHAASPLGKQSLQSYRFECYGYGYTRERFLAGWDELSIGNPRYNVIREAIRPFCNPANT